VTGDGLVRPLNAPPAGQVGVGVQPGTNSVVLARYVIVFGPGDGVFVYQAGTTPKLGNPPIAWLGSGLVDPYGNVLPSTTGVDGSGTFQAGNGIVLNGQGFLVYNGAPGPGDLAASVAPANFTDPYGNSVTAGVWYYKANGAKIGMSTGGSDAGLFLYAAGLTHSTSATQIFSFLANAGLVNETAALAISSGKENGNSDAGLQLFSAAADNSSAAYANIEFGGTVAVFITPSGIAANRPGTAATPETWHALPLLNGWANGSGQAPRYKLMPDGTVFFQGSINGAAATSGVFADLNAAGGAAYTPVTLGQPFHVQSTSLAVSGQEYGLAGTTGHAGFLVVESTVFTNSYVFDGRITLD
jgi:hypothetical protein